MLFSSHTVLQPHLILLTGLMVFQVSLVSIGSDSQAVSLSAARWGTHHTICRHQIKPSPTSNKEDRETGGENDEEKMWFKTQRGSSALHDTSHLIGYQHEPQICRRHIFRGQIGACCWDSRQPGSEGRETACVRNSVKRYMCMYAFEGLTDISLVNVRP